ncbi:birA, biotin-(acetyl-CoA-carboxylase) ligase [Thiovulum sp. ES]|nr:birA, biotin-(acetyl-CoA-carboxylase) ligase [Thiovulum sp. ES]
MKIEKLKQIDSTQTFLSNRIRNGLSDEVLFWTEKQTAGIGSRGNEWIGKEGNLFFSFSISANRLPSDLETQSVSIYFAYLFKSHLESLQSNIFLKWPNDFYLKNKVGGVVANLIKETFVIGIGINRFSVENFGKLDLEISNNEILQIFVPKLENLPNWKSVFEKYKKEFEKSRTFETTFENKKISLEEASLNPDGSILLNGKRLYR